MDIFLRNIDPVAMQKVDELAKENGMSRQKFLKEQFEVLAFFDEQVAKEKRLEAIIDQNIEMMKQCAISIEKMNDIIYELMGDVEE
jgi:nucleoside 2-deoxyribosyltransferase